MAELSVLTRHIESYVDTSCSPSDQATCLDSITSLIKKGSITIEALVRELEMYLTTTDNVIRARGTLLLAESVRSLALMPMDGATIHSLVGFFTDRLADWRALRGALVGCLALLKRRGDIGLVSPSDAKAVAESFLENLQVQSLGQHDRKLCFELLGCLLERYPREVASVGEDLIYGICESFDGEKDPHCLMIVFNIIPALVQQFPSSSESLASFSGELFESLSSYFPIHFTHKIEDEAGVTRDDLSRSLMIAFSSTPLLEPYVIPLLLEKLSTSLQSAKEDSLKYLSHCSVKYGASKMEKHTGTVWSLLKGVIGNSLVEASETFSSESKDGLGFLENEIIVEALVLLEILVKQNNSALLSLIVEDEDISTIFNTISSYGSYKDISYEGKQRLHVVGRILYITSKTSVGSCNRMIETFFPSMVVILQQQLSNSCGDLNFGALYLCTELLAGCRDLVLWSRDVEPDSISACEAFCCILQSLCVSLTSSLCSTLITTANQVHDVDIYFRVKSLQILATFPEDILTISNNIFENVLTTFMSIILFDFEHQFLWNIALKALVHMGSYVSGCNEPEKAHVYTSIVVEKITSLVSVDSNTLPFPLKLEVISEIGVSGRNHMLKIVESLEEALIAKVSEFYCYGNRKSSEMAIHILRCCSNKVIPWICGTKGLEETLLNFAISIWEHVETWMPNGVPVPKNVGLHDAIIETMKLTVASCSVEVQNSIVQKAYAVISSSMSLPLDSIPFQLEQSPPSQFADTISQRDELILSLFASVVIAVHPITDTPNVKGIINLFLTTLVKGHVLSAQALGSMVNKFDMKLRGTKGSSDSMLEKAINVIFTEKLWHSHGSGYLSDDNEKSLVDLCLGCMNNVQLQIHAIVGLAWVGKGLLLRGHEKVKDVIMILLDCLLPAGSTHSLNSKHGLLENIAEQGLHPAVMKAAADAFHILMSDFEFCLTKRFHAIIRPLYKQRFFSVAMPILLSSIKNSDSAFSRCMLYRASAHAISDAPLIVVLTEAKKVCSILLEGLSIFSDDILDKEYLYSLLLVLSGLLTDDKGKEAVMENAHSVIDRLTGLVAYPHMLLVRETAIQCLIAMSELHHARIYPMRTKVLQSLSQALDDRKRAVRHEAVRCKHAWASSAL